MKKFSAKKIAVLRALQLGDMLCAIPAFRALRSAYPSAEVTLIGLPWASEFVERFQKYIDRFIPFPGYVGLPEQKVNMKKFAAFLKNIRKEQFDLLIQMQGDGSVTNSFINQLGAKVTAGSFTENNGCPNNQTFIPYQNDKSEIERNLSIVTNLGMVPPDTLLEFPVFTSDREELQMLPEYILLKKQSYICIHPGARDEKRRWNAKHFSFIADFFRAQGYQVVFTGVAKERSLIQTIVQQMTFHPINLAGKLSLGATAALLKNSQLVVTNCTGISHLADALHTNSVVICCNVDSTRWAPRNKKLHKVIRATEKDTTERVLDEASLFLERRSL